MSDQPKAALRAFTFTLGDKSWTVRPTFRVMRRIEAISAPTPLMRRLAAGEVGFTGIGQLLHAILQDERDAPKKVEEFQQLAFDAGIDQCGPPLSDFITEMWAGNRRNQEEAEAQAADAGPSSSKSE